MSIVSTVANTINNSVRSLPPVMHNRMPVITTELLANVYETDANNIQQNFKRNKGRFVEGKHFFNLTGSILREFKNRLTVSQSVGKNARSLTLWTERGAARHAKMLDTDKAWDVFEALEDFYFNQKEAEEVKPKTRRSTASQLTPLRQTAERLITTGLGRIYPDIWKLVHEHFEVKHITQLEPSQITEAIEFLNVLEGEYLGKEELPVLHGYSGFSGKLLMELENGEVVYSSALTPNHHVATINDFMEIAQRAGYLLIRKEDMQPMMKALEGYKFNA
ncbi:conserved hypothetical protein [Xenorhabdus bovienii str. puntauvense]|uniref:KilA-N DNA-binding domain-containing protein n=1 Tax=Xenorhabdus bovienii str. puntauvense TaxID=1398201 RepID=A0A077NEJ1_XENBV|nr:ORF6N domain-containing protein [Xenorhabdus bovienii]CDG96667.1 conserved hypothetical protein [Xenorhabdus bovienii str. puntauvense]